MGKAKFLVAFWAFLLCLALISGTASSALLPMTAFAAEDQSSEDSPGQTAIEKADAAFEAAGPIVEKLKKMVTAELTASDPEIGRAHV